jgi:hypothetical protein
MRIVTPISACLTVCTGLALGILVPGSASSQVPSKASQPRLVTPTAEPVPLPPGQPTAVTPQPAAAENHLNRSANYFWQMWELIEARKGSVQ